MIMLIRRHNIMHNDTQYNDIQHNDTQHNDTQHNDTQHNDTQHNDTQHNNTQHNNKRITTLSINGTLHRVWLFWVSFILNVFNAECHKLSLYAGCRYADCHGAIVSSNKWEIDGKWWRHKKDEAEAGKPNWTGRLGTVDLLFKLACFVNKENNISIEKTADLN